MDYRPSESLKAVAAELASFIANGKQREQKAGELLQELAPAAEAENGAPDDPELSGPRDRADIRSDLVGIWKSFEKNGEKYYRRDPAKKNEWHLWADIHEIPPKGRKKRVILLGESVARGFLYDPFYNVAKELQAILAGTKELCDGEIVDLSRVSMVLTPLADLLASCLQLQPDAVIVFAGNNWVYSLNEMSYDQEELLALFDREGIAGLKCFREQQMKKVIIDFFRLVEDLFLKKQIPVVFVIPEFNLKDWKSHAVEQVLPWAPDDRIEKWLTSKKNAENALKRAAMEDLASAARQMVEMDNSNPYGYELLGSYYVSCGQFEDARLCLESARDTIIFSRSNNSMPRCIRVVRDTILSEAGSKGIPVVDLPAIFKEAFPESIPDRMLFLDNCHLTVNGIKIAARHMARTLIEAMIKEPVDIQRIHDSDILPEDHVQAVAHFCAAIYNAHYGQGAEIVSYHCHKALSFSPLIRDAMLRYCDFSTRYASTILCRTFGELLSSGEMQQYGGGYALKHPRNRKLMDVTLTNAIADALDLFGFPTAGERADALRLKEHGVEEETDLLESFYRHDSYHDFFAGTNTSFIQVRSTESNFNFIATGDHPLTIRMVYRTPNRSYPEKYIFMHVNQDGSPAAELPMSEKWRTTSFTISADRIVKGINRLTICWPYTTEPILTEKDTSSDAFLRTVFPVLAEIHCLIIFKKMP